MMRMVAAGLSDVGRVRSHNEDSFAIDLDHGLFVVADGMGGHQHGEVASRLAVESIRQRVEKRRRALFSGSGGQDDERGERLATAIQEAHAEVLAAIQNDFSLLGMGTTVVALLVHEDVAAIAHVGDSRAYRLAGSRLELLTQDHTWVREQIAAGHLSEQQAREHPLKNVVTQALGGSGAIAVDATELTVQPGDLFLLCTDGLTSMLEDGEIAEILQRDEPLEDLCSVLVREANRRGGLDNVTVLLVGARAS